METGEQPWERQAKSVVRAELMRRGMSHEVLVERLAMLGVDETVLNLRKKLSRGRFSAVFLLQLLAAIGVEFVHPPPPPGTSRGDEAAGEYGAQALARRFEPRKISPGRSR